MKTLTQAELTALLAACWGVSKAEGARILDGLTATLQEALQAGNAVTIPGIAKLSPVAKPARLGRNPRTGESVEIPAKVVVKATISKPLKDALN